jgi:hypothetical protein
MSKVFTLIFACLFFAGTSNAQKNSSAERAKQHIRLYLQGGYFSGNVKHTDPTRNKEEIFSSKGLAQPLFGLGAILEAKSDKPGTYFGIGFSYSSFDYEGERYVRIISPSQEELEKYKGKHSLLNIDLFIGRYIFLGNSFALKPQVGFSFISAPKNELTIDVYDYQDGDLKRSYEYDRKKNAKLGLQAGLFLSFKKSIEAGLLYHAPYTLNISRENASKYSSVGAVIRYIHSF